MTLTTKIYCLRQNVYYTARKRFASACTPLQNDIMLLFLFDKPLKGFKSLKIFKISLTFRFDIYQNPFTQEKVLKF
jgi:hypothetical protein